MTTPSMPMNSISMNSTSMNSTSMNSTSMNSTAAHSTPLNIASVTVDIDNACDAMNIPDDSTVQRWIATALVGLRQRAYVSIRIVDEQESAELNHQYRHKNYATNILSFPSDLPEHYEPPLLGDLAICAAVVQREAAEQHKSPDAHWAHMLVHGTLHLLGFDHIDDSDAAIMEAREITILHQLGFNDPYN
jgi:probable rRNA maturation factor